MSLLKEWSRAQCYQVERVLLESSIILQGMMDQAYSKEDKPSDDHPLWLPAATVDGFRALLWILLTTYVDKALHMVLRLNKMEKPRAGERRT